MFGTRESLFAFSPKSDGDLGLESLKRSLGGHSGRKWFIEASRSFYLDLGCPPMP